MNIYDVYGLGSRFRVDRMKRFMDVMKPTAATKILDVGGYPQFWDAAPFTPNVTLLQYHEYQLPEEYAQRGFRHLRGDGTALDFADNEFDLVVSNSVIEHVGNESKQINFAKETRRVGRSYWVQTPAWEFPVEPHCLTPFIHWLPNTVRRALIPRFTVWSLLTKDQSQVAIDDLKGVRMLSRGDVRKMFPDGELLTERFVGWPKSHVAYRQAPRGEK